MSGYSRENPEAPELDAGEIEERTETRRATALANLQKRSTPPDTLVDWERKPVHGDAIPEAEVSRRIGLSKASLSRYRKRGLVNPKLLLTNTNPFASPQGMGVIVWYRESLVEDIANSRTTEPFYVPGEAS